MTITGWAAFWLGIASVIVLLGLFSALENIIKTALVTHCINKTVKRITSSDLSEEQLKKVIDAMVDD